MRPVFVLAALAGAVFAQAPKPSSRDVSIARVATAEELAASVEPPRGYAVVIGIAKYGKLPQDANLHFPESDAMAVYRALISKEGGNIEPENIQKLIGPDATAANIRRALEVWLPSVAKEQDRVIVYFAGHGLAAPGGQGYLAPYDVDPGRISETGYSMESLGKVLGATVKAKWKVLLADACHSGKITPQSTQAQVYGEFTKLPNSFLTFTSSREQESSYEDPALSGGFGLYSYYLVQGWMGNADTDPRDGIVTADELIEYVRREVRNHARTARVAQTPTERGDFPGDMILGFSPSRRSELRAAAGNERLPDGSIVVEVNLDDVDIYIDDKLQGRAGPGKNLRVPGLASGQHVIKGVRSGYDPASKEVIVYPGQEQTVTLRIQYKRNIKKSAAALYDEGMAIYSRRKSEGDLKKAANLFQRALAEDGHYPDAAMMLCLTLQVLAETDAGRKACKSAVDLDPGYVEARMHYAALLVESGDTRAAVDQLQTAVRQDPSNSHAYSNLAEAFLLARSYDKAEEAANQAIRLSDRNSQAFLFRGDAKRYLSRHDEAIADYRRYLELDNFVAPLYQKVSVWVIGTGLSYRNAGQKRVYATQQSSAYFGLCDCEVERRNFLRARDYCLKAVDIDKSDANAHYLLGTVYMDLFNRDNRREYLVKAEQSIARSLDLNPEAGFSKEARTNLARVREILPRVR